MVLLRLPRTWREVVEMVSVEQYPLGTDVLWMAHFRDEPDGGDMDGVSMKCSGTLQEACEKPQQYAEEEGIILQCIRRRY